ncbi:dynamin family protein [Brevibacillus sp. SYSU BS000544]|uniref:dynamin family protein n=1 Tax=Brevibacillus sp. SYSU BS000544 TaxID=3416443 RepID=UPI003CE45146
MNQLKTKLLTAADKLQRTSSEITAIPGMQTLAAELTQRAERLRTNQFTVALFGAFSAGKSSFANAMMGDMVLPVSPNPTTAAINKIMPPTDQYPHGTVRVIVKTKQAIEADVLRSLAVFDLTANDLEQGLAAIGSIDVAQMAPQAKPHYTFLRAVAKGLPEMADHLGKELIVDQQAFKSLVAKEEKACFTEYIELYYSCPLTDQGIVLVDTPGADSINARHTGVAFDYIKNADAVLFVTYYNHAFAHADREFLLQMGRVKDTFELDKMFFVVNAADLAATPEELTGVLQHVEKNLLSCGIRHPRLYPISSQTALLARMHEKGKLAASAEKVYRQRTNAGETDPLPSPETGLELSGILRFEQDFMKFSLEELTEMAVTAAHNEMKRVDLTLQEFIEMAQAGEDVRRERREQAEVAQDKAISYVRAHSTDSEERDFQREQDELVYYVKQRLFFRFNELFNMAFNPAVIKDDGRNLKKALQSSLQDLLRSIAYDLAQELRATTLRLEKFLNKQGNQMIKLWERELGAYTHNFQLAPYQPRKVDTPDFDEELAVSLASFQSALGLFKNTKDFFEMDGKTRMRDELEKLMQQPVDTYLAGGSRKLGQRFASEFSQMVEEEKSHVVRQIEEYFTGLFAATDMKIDVDELRQKQQVISEFLQ